MPFRYVPLLRAKVGEANALLHLAPADKARLFPILHLASTLSPQVLVKIGQAWTGRHLGLDGLFNYNIAGSATQMQNAFGVLTTAGVNVVPSVEFGAPSGYTQAVSQMVAGGLIVKARLGDLQAVPNWLATAGWHPQSVDLVIVAGHIADFGAGVLNSLVQHSLQNLPQQNAWRSVTLAGSAAPKDFSGLGLGPALVPRLDWQLWQATSPQVAFQLDYGDFGIAHPDMTEPPGYVMGKATVSARYTLDNEWLLIKGRPVSGVNGIPMPTQYLGHAQILAATPTFGGLVGCWGDLRIQSIAGGTGTPGSRQTWVEAGVNRHLCLVANRLP